MERKLTVTKELVKDRDLGDALLPSTIEMSLNSICNSIGVFRSW